MSNFSGAIQRPLVAAAAVAVASFSAEFSDKLPSNGSSSSSSDCSTSNLAHSTVGNYLQELDSSWVSRISVSKLSDLNFVTKVPVHVPDVRYHRVPSLGHNLYHSSFASSPLFQNLYQSADLLRVPRPSVYSNGVSASTSEVSYKWHLPQPSALGGSNGSSEKPKKTVVVLLGWLGAKQRHLRKYAEWYTSKGFHVVTFTFPMDEVLRYKPGGKAEQNVELLADHLADWLEGENEKNMIFHTFSNTGWLIYGVILEHLEKQNQSVMERIKGCIVDSAPVAYPDPEVWASGFSAAFLKKNSVAAKGHVISNESGIKVSISKPAPSEAALLLVLKKCFQVILNLPTVNRRLSDVMSMLSSKQPNCPQLYMYSSADRVIPCDSVESFVEAQRKAGHDVRACNFVSSPHVDHFRNDPKLYTSQISQFLEDCLLPNNNCKSS